MRQSGLIQQAIVSYKIPRLADQQNDGEITLGAMNPSKFTGSVVTFPNVNTQGFWEGAMGAFKVDGKDMGLVNRTGVLDTGTVSLDFASRSAGQCTDCGVWPRPCWLVHLRM